MRCLTGPREPPEEVGVPADHDVDLRAEQAIADGDELICVAPSAALGIDRLPPGESAELAAAWLEGALAPPQPFRPWAAAGTRVPDPALPSERSTTVSPSSGAGSSQLKV